MTKTTRPKPSGRYCWCCGRRRPNENFSRKRGVCSGCAKLGATELAYRQQVRNIDRLLTPDGRVAKHQERTFAGYLVHEDARVRAYAEAVDAAMRQRRDEHLAALRIDEAEWDAVAAVYEELGQDEAPSHFEGDAEDIPF